ncbi:hypothetical protein FPRO06_05003 [Fusarium proliferatum]|nr:hypothetical protein FPRO06_05003 [Fusarium proliferatum]
MRVVALPLLAICQLVCASPCKPSSSTTIVSSSTIGDETKTSTTFFTESMSIPLASSSTIANEAETSTTLLTESTAVSETEAASGSTTDVTSETATSTILINTSNAEPTTLATSTAEPTTTTTVAAAPTNVITNPGFESADTAPWYTLGNRGVFSIALADSHSGLFSGHLYAAGFTGPVVLGVDHPVDSSLIKADTEYHYSIWIKTSAAVNCQSRKITCGAGGGYISSSDWAGPYNEWTEFTMSCTWSQAFLDMVPSIQIRAECEGLEFYVDDAVLIEAN